MVHVVILTPGSYVAFLKNPNILQFVLQSENYSSAKLIIYSMNAMYKIPNDLSVGRPI